MSRLPALPEPALEVWRFTADAPMTVHVPPDGCRDLIAIAPKGGAPTCLVSPLSQASEMHAFAPGDQAMGVRLRPGAQFDDRALLALLRARDGFDDGDLLAAVGAAARVDARVDEALACLHEAPSLALAHARLGVSARSLERLLAARTRRGPLWWRNLARVRRCARGLAGATSLAALAADHGYADQAHMTRDLRRWFDASPTQLRAMPAFLATLEAPAYA
jgi:AraC-like DNA-binding protein